MVTLQANKKNMQTTLASSVSCHGIGLHSGLLVNMTLKPAPCDFGVVFRRTDLAGVNSVRASRGNLKDTVLSTSLESGKVHIQTVEHLLGALVGLGVDNVLVELDAPEVPIMDGSALPFVRLIRQAGLKPQRKLRAYMEITQPVSVREGDKTAVLLPARATSISCEIDFAHALLSHQRAEYQHTEADFVAGIAPARTFGFKKDIDALVRAGFARGGSLDNAVVLDEVGVVNEGGLRFPDEFARHKILDAIGDLSLAGYPILGRLVIHKSGHTLNARLVETLLCSKGSWKIIHPRESFLGFSFQAVGLPQPLTAQPLSA